MTALIGIRREDKSRWERRAPLTPAQVGALRQQAGLSFVIQSSQTRIFSDEQYRRAGAIVADSLHDCPVILGIKEIPPQFLEAGKTYVFFSHTIKGQPHNMPMLRRLMELGCTLIDYERITDAAGRRLIFFGRHAGLAGMLDSLWALGQRLSWEGIATPFASLRRAFEYANLDDARAAVRAAGAQIAAGALTPALQPLVVGIAGYGNVSRGAQEILDLLPVQEIAAGDLASLSGASVEAGRCIYKVVFREQDTVEPIAPTRRFDLDDYYQHPIHYRSRFENYLPYLTLLINAIYWDSRYPRLVTRAGLKRLFASPQPRLRVIGDISCDIEGAIEATDHCTQPDQPVYVYQPASGEVTPGVAGYGPVILAVDILPAELPRESSEAFGEALMPFVPALSAADFSLPFEACPLPAEIRRAVICYAGRLTPAYDYLRDYLAEPAFAPSRSAG
jgi:saccharopine dehydrogenase (NAD+, L-lysine-forming)